MRHKICSRIQDGRRATEPWNRKLAMLHVHSRLLSYKTELGEWGNDDVMAVRSPAAAAAVGPVVSWVSWVSCSSSHGNPRFPLGPASEGKISGIACLPHHSSLVIACCRFEAPLSVMPCAKTIHRLGTRPRSLGTAGVRCRSEASLGSRMVPLVHLWVLGTI